MSADESKNGISWVSRPLEDGDLLSDTGGMRETSLFLGRYTLNEVFAVLGKKGFYKEARKRHLWPLVFDLDSSASPLQRLRIFLREKDPDLLIVDLKIREGIFSPKKELVPKQPIPSLKSLFVEWLTLQNPSAEFSEKHGALPGQQHPGLGMSKKIMDLFVYLGKQTRVDSILAFPAYYHNAVLFSRYFRFFNPEKEGEVQSLRRTFSHMSIRQLAWAVHLNCLKTTEGGIYEWKSEEQVFPFSRELKEYFDSKAYKEIVKQSLNRSGFVIDPIEFERKFGAID